jgi:hypothetical protein
MLFNVNDTVRVKLTDYGRAMHRANHDGHNAGRARRGLPPIAYLRPKEDADGWSKWQLWELMREFGPHVGLGRDVPFATTIEIPDAAPGT